MDMSIHSMAWHYETYIFRSDENKTYCNCYLLIHKFGEVKQFISDFSMNIFCSSIYNSQRMRQHIVWIDDNYTIIHHVNIFVM